MSEWQTVRAPVDELTVSDRDLTDALRTADGGRIVIDERRDGVWVTSRSWVGVVRFEAFELRVVPKLEGGNLAVARMLDYASGINALRRYDALHDLETVGDDLLELIAWLFADAVDRLVRDGLLSDYVTREDSLHALRGRLRMLDQMRVRYGQIDPLEVVFDEFETDIPENQIVAAALSAIRALVRTPFLRTRVKKLNSILQEASDPTRSGGPLQLVDEMVYTRRNAHYRNAHVLADLLLRRLATRDIFRPSGTEAFAFLLDMNELFESFVARLAMDVLSPLGVRVRSQRRDPSIIIDESTGKRYKAIIPDLLLELRRRGHTVRLPVDSKYKLYDEKKLDEADVYQTFFYAYAYAPTERGLQPAQSVIVYPRATDGRDVSLRIETHAGTQSARIQAFGLDVAGALEAVARGRPGLGSVPAIARVHRVLKEVATDIGLEEQWRGLSA